MSLHIWNLSVSSVLSFLYGFVASHPHDTKLSNFLSANLSLSLYLYMMKQYANIWEVYIFLSNLVLI